MPKTFDEVINEGEVLAGVKVFIPPPVRHPRNQALPGKELDIIETNIHCLPRDILNYMATFFDGLSFAAMERARKSFYPNPQHRNAMWKAFVLAEISDQPCVPEGMSWKQFYGRAYKTYLKIVPNFHKLKKLAAEGKINSSEYKEHYIVHLNLLQTVVIEGYDKFSYLFLAVSGKGEFFKLNTSQPIKRDSVNSFLHLAASHGRDYFLKLFLEKSSEVDGSVKVALNNHVYRGYAEYIYGETPLAQAAAHGHLGCMNQLLDKGANPNYVNKNNCETPLHVAAKNGHVEAVKLLLERGGAESINARDENKKLPLDLACQRGHFACVELLEKRMQNLSIDSPKKQQMKIT